MEFSEAHSEKHKPKVAIIGAGPTGIVCCRHLLSVSDVFESKSELGGLWIYTDTNELNHDSLESDGYYQLYKALHHSMYADLCTNIPKQFMTYKDFPHSDDAPYLLTHSQFLEYLNDYADKFEVRDKVKFNTTVVKIKVEENNEHRYRVDHISTNITEGIENEVTSSYFDFVIVCNGHFTQTNKPYFEGMETFTGNQFHVHNFRKFESDDFENKNVLIVGSYLSAIDMIHHIFFSQDTKDKVNPSKVFITSRYTEKLENSTVYKDIKDRELLIVKPGNLQRIDKDTAYFGDGSNEKVDTIIFATGYLYSLPFFDPQDNIIQFDCCCEPKRIDPNAIWDWTKGRYFGPLYKKMFWINEPGIAFLGLVERLNIIQMTMERQTLLIKELVNGDLVLPSKQEMLDDLEKELQLDDDLISSKLNFFRCRSKTYSVLDYNRDLWKLTKMKVDTENYMPLFDGYSREHQKLIDGNDPLWIKLIDFDEAFEGKSFNPTSETF